MGLRRNTSAKGFSLVELVIVIVIIGIIAAIAIPRVTQATKGAGESALAGNLSILRNAIEMYASEHNGVYPGAVGPGGDDGGDNTPEAFVSQLTKYSDGGGLVATTRSATHPFGPYLRKGIPPLPVGAKQGKTGVKVVSGETVPAVDAGDFGWIYNATSGEIIANASETDDDSKAYSTY